MDDEDDLVRFVVFMRQVLARGEGTIRQKLFAVRYAHLLAGFNDPLEGKARLWAAMAGLKRWTGKVERKLLKGAEDVQLHLLAPTLAVRRGPTRLGCALGGHRFGLLLLAAGERVLRRHSASS